MTAANASTRNLARALAVATVLVLGAAACSSSSSASGTTTTAEKATTAAKPAKYYVSLGDSYAAGYQPTGVNVGHTTKDGYAYQVPGLLAKEGVNLKLVNFACGGATTTSIISTVGCPPQALGPDGVKYPDTTQEAAAVDFITKHKGDIGLITVSISGNDVTKCAKASNAIACVGDALNGINTNVSKLLTDVRQAAGPDVPIIGITYPDVILGGYVSGNPAAKDLADLSVTAFKSLINPALSKLYEGVGGKFVDITEATGAYTPLTETTELAPYGTIPVAVAKVCELTYYCELRDIHPKTAGYKIIADLVAGTLPKLATSHKKH